MDRSALDCGAIQLGPGELEPGVRLSGSNGNHRWAASSTGARSGWHEPQGRPAHTKTPLLFSVEKTPSAPTNKTARPQANFVWGRRRGSLSGIPVYRKEMHSEPAIKIIHLVLRLVRQPPVMQYALPFLEPLASKH